MRTSEKFKIIGSCLSGNVLEWFDFAVYGYLAPIIASQFFPSKNKLASILLTYGIFAIGFIVRPLGAIFFGHLGDTRGRKTALILSSITMAIPTFAIGILPVYSQVGLLAPFLLMICRIFQGLSLGGEFTGSFIYLIEQAIPGRKGFFSCWADIGCSLGMILGSACAALLNSVLTPEQLANYGWRLPFLSGIFLATVAIWMRSKLFESVAFLQVKREKHPLKHLLEHYPKTLIYTSLLVAINSLGFYMLVVFIPNQTVFMGILPANQDYWLNIIVLAVVMISTFLTAFFCDYYDKTKIYIMGIFGCILLAFPTFYALSHFSLAGQIIMMCLMAVAVGSCYGPRPLFMVEIFPPQFRNSGIAVAFNIANAGFGGTAPLLATYLVAKTNIIEIPAVLVILSALITLFSILNLKQQKFILNKSPASYFNKLK
jgi:MFS transporter, MHS family, proline/betaine transporter